MPITEFIHTLIQNIFTQFQRHCEMGHKNEIVASQPNFTFSYLELDFSHEYRCSTSMLFKNERNEILVYL